MTEKPERKIPELAVPRLSQYYHALLECPDQEVISSDELSEKTGHSAAQIRKDLTYFGQFGRPGLGYNVEELRKALVRILGIDKEWNVGLVGVGNLGMALLGHRGFRRQGFKFVAAFDQDARKTGREVEGVPIHPMTHFEDVSQRENLRMIILTVPAPVAQEVTSLLVKTQVKAILNFAPLRLQVPDHVTVHYIDMAVELERLSFRATWSESGGGPKISENPL